MYIVAINSCCQNNECESKHYIRKADVSLAILKLKPGKTKCQLQSEHLKNGSELLFNHISNLLSSMLLHAYIPVDILTSTILPIPKDRKKSLHDSSNYKGIVLNSLLGKNLDYILLTNYKNVFQTSGRQFGFKAKHSTVQCTFVVKETLQYYIIRGSSLLLLLLDATKAFDRVNYVKLFNLLIKKGICPLVARLLAAMYNKQQAQMKWGQSSSKMFRQMVSSKGEFFHLFYFQFTSMNNYTESHILAMVVLLVRRSWAALHMLMI